MKNTFIKAICFIFISAFAMNATSQTTTINYLQSSLSTSACNVFNPSVPVNGITHSSRAGGVSFNASEGLLLSTTPQSNTPGGTAFVISYNFAPNNNYTISITAKGDPAISLKSCVVPNLNQFSTNGTTACSPDPNAYVYNTVGVGQFSTPNNTNGATYNIPQFTIPGTNIYPILIIWSTGGRANLTLDNFSISQITITQTPIGSFSVSPSSLTIPCGSSNAQTFTANNNSNTPNVTNHVWNLGSANNGWLFNGNPAPQTISTGTTNSISLTPDCGKVQTNISATITAGSTNFNTSNSSIISISQPSYSISGNNSLCSGNTNYTLNGLVCSNPSILWTAPPSNLGSLSSLTTSPTTLTYGGTSGSFTLTAKVTSCGVENNVTLPVHVGPYTSSDFNLNVSGGNGAVNGYLPWCPNTTYGFSVSTSTTGATGSNYVWTIPQGWTQNYISNYLCVVNSPTGTYPPTGSMDVSFTEGCGTTINKSMFVAVSSNCNQVTEPAYTYWPNPVTYTLNVEVASQNIGLINIRGIEIINQNTYQMVFSQSYGSGVNNTSIMTYYYQQGYYILRVYDGTIWRSYQFLKL